MPTQPSTDEFGFDETRSSLTDALGRFVPQAVGRRALAVSVSTDRDRYDRGDPVELTVVIRNRLPVPVHIVTPGRRLWGWTVDGELEASDEPRFAGDDGGVLTFRANERKVTTHTWDGRLKRSGPRTRWVLPDPGPHEIRAFVATAEPRPTDATTIHVD